MKSFLILFIFNLVVCSGSIFASTFYNKKFEEVLPITCTGIVLILFLFGFIHNLIIGVYVVILVALVLLGLSIYKFIKIEDKKMILHNFFSFGTLIYALMNLFCIFVLYGKLFNANDEFSHWGDVVKTMTLINDFGANKAGNTLFPTYLPGVSLFQYFIEEISLFVSGVFKEWLCNYAYAIFGISFVLPIINQFKEKKLIGVLLICASLVLVPYIFYPTYAYKEIYIETFLCLLLGSGLLELTYYDNSIVSFLRFCSIITMLTLAKDVGIMFAAFLEISFVLICIKNNYLDKVKKIIYSILFIIIPKVMWIIVTKVNGVETNFKSTFTFSSLIAVLTGKDTTYRMETFRNYWNAFISEGVELSYFQIKINYVVIILVLFVLLFVTTKLLNNKESKIVSIVYVSLFVIYILGQCFAYLYNFSEEEAIRHASFNRYTCMLLFAATLYIFINLEIYFVNKQKYIFSSLALICLIGLVPMDYVISLCLREPVNTSIAIRDTYEAAIENVNKYVDEDERVGFMTSSSSNYEYLYMKYCLRPYELIYGYSHENTLLLFEIDDDFADKYGYLFEKKDDIKSDGAYYLDPETDLYVLYH